MPVVCYRPASSNLTVITRYNSLFEQDKSAANHFFSICGISLPFSYSHHGVSVNVAYAHHDNNRNVFDEWLFTYQGSAHPSIMENRRGEFLLPFTCFLTKT